MPPCPIDRAVAIRRIYFRRPFYAYGLAVTGDGLERVTGPRRACLHPFSTMASKRPSQPLKYDESSAGGSFSATEGCAAGTADVWHFNGNRRRAAAAAACATRRASNTGRFPRFG